MMVILFIKMIYTSFAVHKKPVFWPPCYKLLCALAQFYSKILLVVSYIICNASYALRNWI